MKIEKYIVWLIAAAVSIKLVLFLYIAGVNPASIMEADSSGYLRDAAAWMQYFHTPSEGLQHSLYRTPGYTFFLAIFHLWLNLPLLSIILLQFILNIFTAIVVFKTIPSIDRRIALLSAAIVLLDLPMTIFSSMIMTESLHVFVLSLFIFSFVKYINNRQLGWLAGAAVFLMVSVYIRPVGYFLGFAMGAFVLYLWGKNILVGVAHALVALVLVYGFLGIWQYHNLKTFNDFTFTNIDHATLDQNGIIGRYSREIDPSLKAMPPVLYYVYSVGRNIINLMTTPGDMKYLHSGAWRIFGAAFGYLFVIFWWIGLIVAVRRFRGDIVEQFLLLVLVYFISVAIVSTGWHVTPRFRVPMVPMIAILSARGWMVLLGLL